MIPAPAFPRIIFVNRFYWPDEAATAQLLTDLAEALAARGRAVTVIASRPDESVPRRETRHGVEIFRVPSTRSRRHGLAGKALDLGTFHLLALGQLTRLARRGDAIVALTDPPLIGVGAVLAARWRRTCCLHWIHDIYPEVAMAVTGRGILRLLRPWRNAAWRSAAACVTLGSEMASVVAAAGVAPGKIRVIPNWAPVGSVAPPEHEIHALRASWGVAESFVVAYSGNLGRVHDFEPLLAAAEALREDPRFAFLFIGDGAQRAELKAAARARRLAAVRFLPAQPRSLLGTALAASDAQVISVRAGCERYVFPSKLYGAAAAGRPVLFVGPRDCEPARLVAQHGFGLAFGPGEGGALAAALRGWADLPDECARLGAAASRFAAHSPGAAATAAIWDDLTRPVRTG